MRGSKLILGLAIVIVLAAASWLLWENQRPLSPDAGKTGSDATAPPVPRSAESSPSNPIRPKPFVEDDAAATRDLSVEIEIVESSGQPVPGARVAVFRADEILLSAKTDQTAVVRLEPSAGEARVVVAKPGAQLLCATITLTPGRTRLTLPDGLEISGSVQVEGRPPPSSVVMSLSRTDQSERLEFKIPSAVRDILDFRDSYRTWRAETDAAGLFGFVGLPKEFQGSIWVEDPYRLKEIFNGSEKLIRLNAPLKGIIVSVERYPVISGRTVDAATGAPLQDAKVNVIWDPANLASLRGSTFNSGTGLRSGKDGRFAVTVGLKDLAAIHVTLAARAGTAAKVIDITDRLDEDHDLGDIPVDAGRLVSFVVKDSAGSPIANARAMPPQGTHFEASAPTNSDGGGMIRLTAESTSINVGALRYEVAQVPIPAELVGPVAVTLQSGTGLCVRVVTADDSPATGVGVALRCKQDIFAKERGPSYECLLAAGMSQDRGRRQAPESSTFLFDTDAAGVVTLSGIVSGVPIHVEVRDATGEAKFAADVTLTNGEWREITGRLDGRPRVFSGIVTDTAGQPIFDADVLVASSPEALDQDHYRILSSHLAKTDRQGRFSFPDLGARTTNVRVWRTGYASLVKHDVPIPADATETRFALALAQVVRITITDSSGAPVEPPIEIIGEMRGYPRIRGRHEKPGIYVFEDFGQGSLEVRVKIANGRWTRTIDTSKTLESRIVVPVLGTLRVTWDRSLTSAAGRLGVRVEMAGQSDRSLFEFVRPEMQDVRFDAVMPGAYSVKLVDPQSRKSGEGETVIAHGSVTVTEGQAAAVTLSADR